MIKIYDQYKKLVAQIDNLSNPKGEGFIPTIGKDCLIYIKLDKNNSDALDIMFDVYEKTADDWFPVQYDDGAAIVTYKRRLSEDGNYRIPVPTTKNEDQLKIKVEDIRDSDVNDNVLEAEIYMIPNFTQF